MMTGAFVPADGGESAGRGVRIVLDGAVSAGTPVVQVGAATHRVEAGGGVFVPRGVARTFATAPGADVTFLAHLPGPQPTPTATER